jgi:hypothetical protein
MRSSKSAATIGVSQAGAFKPPQRGNNPWAVRAPPRRPDASSVAAKPLAPRDRVSKTVDRTFQWSWKSFTTKVHCETCSWRT